jgi:cyclopropane fatty-acyl-phospholipid synthase-like methyltransferase
VEGLVSHTHLKKFVKRGMGDSSGAVLEVGSLDVNGSIRKAANVTIGIDIQKGRSVDIVMNACDTLEYFGEESFDAVVSVDAIEHSVEWKCFIQNMIGLLKTGNKLLLTAASPKKGRHNYPNDYWRFTEKMFRTIFEHQEVLEYYEHKISNGVIVRKIDNRLNLDFEPLRIK